jgi:glycosyltransferase involved in cell wall biosynthesis/SAM-dependent methyltransferase/regulator of replication initiation timing
MSTEALSVFTAEQSETGNTAQIKINLGCGGAWQAKGWFGVDQGRTSDIWQDSSEQHFIDLDLNKGLPFATGSVDVIFSSHTLEHFTYEEGLALLYEIYRVLKVGAPLCLVVPDLDTYIRGYLRKDTEFLYTPQIIGGEPKDNLTDNFLMNFYSDPRFNNTCHKYAYNFENLSSRLRMVGFREIEQVPFHDFSYWPELKGKDFRSPIPHIERFSLSVQCRKTDFDPSFRNTREFLNARKFGHFHRTEHDLAQHLNTALILNDGLRHENSTLKSRTEELEQLNRALHAANEGQLAEAAALRNNVERLTAEANELRRDKSDVIEANNNLGIERERLLRTLDEQSEELEVWKDKAQILENQGRALRASHAEAARGIQELRARAVSSKGINALTHYIQHGEAEGRSTSPDFDSSWYREKYPDIGKSGLDPYHHFMRFGRFEGRLPRPDAKPYAASNGRAVRGSSRKTALPNSVVMPAANEAMQKIIARSESKFDEPEGFTSTRYSPVISVLLPVFNTPARYLTEAIDSVRNQIYTNWELCIVDDGSTQPHCAQILKEAAKCDKRIRIATSDVNEGIARSSQKGLNMATGDFVSFLDHDDVLAPNALLEVVNALRVDPMLDVIYTDHASITEDGVVASAGLKPDWSPEFFLSTNYIVHLKVIRRSTAISVGGFEGTLHIAQDIGLTCKLSEREATFHHISKALYYWRAHENSVSIGTSGKPEIETVALQTYNDSLRRRSVPATVVWPDYFRRQRVGAYKLDFRSDLGKRAAIVLLEDESFDPDRLQRLLKKTDFSPVPEVHVIHVGGRRPQSLPQGFIAHKAETMLAVNDIVSSIDCDVLVFLSPSARLLSPAWLKELVGYVTVSPRIGAVGGKILDQSLCVTGGGLLLLDNISTICEGLCDESDGYWFNGRLASNVEAVSSRLMAVPKHIYTELGGIPFDEYGEAAGLYWGLKLKANGYRTVYNPWAKVVDFAAEKLPADIRARLSNSFGVQALKDRSYHPFFSKSVAYTIE